MSYQPAVAGAPANAPGCWSRQYQESDRECTNCDFKTSCKNAFLSQNSIPQSRPVQIQTASPQFAPPPPPYAAPQQRPPVAYAPPGTPPVVYQQPQYAQPPQYQPQYPAPMQHAQPPMPQGQAPRYIDAYRAQYPVFHQESTAERLGKNVVLKMLETACGELARFFHFWPWPPSE